MYFQVEINLSFQIGKKTGFTSIYLSYVNTWFFLNFLIFFTVGITRKNHLLNLKIFSGPLGNSKINTQILCSLC